MQLERSYGDHYVKNNEPTIANLYPSFSASKANPDLTPEKSATLEVSGSSTLEKYSALLSLWAYVSPIFQNEGSKHSEASTAPCWPSPGAAFN